MPHLPSPDTHFFVVVVVVVGCFSLAGFGESRSHSVAQAHYVA